MSVRKLLALDPEDISAIIRAADTIWADLKYSDVNWSDTPTLYLVQIEATRVLVEERQAKYERRK